MRNVQIITTRTDWDNLLNLLEDSGFHITTVHPGNFDSTTGPSIADLQAILLDTRDFSWDSLQAIVNACEEQDIATLLLIEDEKLENLTLETKTDDFVLLPSGNKQIAIRLERIFHERFGIDEHNEIRYGALTINLVSYHVDVGGTLVILTFKEYQLLRYLAMNTGEVSTREQLLNKVWGYDYFGGARTVDVHIRRLRSKIEIDGHKFIETVRNVGYRLTPLD